MSSSDKALIQLPLLPRFGIGFLQDHAGLIMTDPKIAIVELVANAWDAGADKVEIKWPESGTGLMAIEDNGTGMTESEFKDRWCELGYSRVHVQGDEVVFPKANRVSNRKAFGRNGKGRHSMFCFSDAYTVETWRDGTLHRFRVSRASGRVPFTITEDGHSSKKGNGTRLACSFVGSHLPVEAVRDLIGSKFVADPSFKIFVNRESVELTDLEHLSDSEEVIVEDLGTVLVHRFDSHNTGRTSKQHGVAWWVNKRLVGDPSWKGFDDDAYLDARTSEAKRYTFVVEADILADQVVADWSEFKDSGEFNRVHKVVKEHIWRKLHQLMKDVHKSRKRAAIAENGGSLRDLPLVSRYQVGEFLDDLQVRCPTIGQRELSATVEVLARLEKVRTGYALLEKLAHLDADDLDGLNEILATWSVHDARIVLDELHWRLEVLKSLESLVENPSSDELHDIQPLFERGLWIFGPEYEGVSFIANKALSTVVGKFLSDQGVVLSTPRRRPDFVALPDASIGVYSRDGYDERGEVNGVSKLLIVELKKGGFEITRKERQQPQDYASEIRKSGKIQRATDIVGFVLGTTIADDAREEVREGSTTIYPRTYSVVIQQAHARTFSLQKKLQEANKSQLTDPDVEQVLAEHHRDMFEKVSN